MIASEAPGTLCCASRSATAVRLSGPSSGGAGAGRAAPRRGTVVASSPPSTMRRSIGARIAAMCQIAMARRRRNGTAAIGLPTALHAQTLRKIATEHVLPEVIELALEIDEDLAADVAPQPAERVVLREVAPRVRVDHAVVEAPVQMRFRMPGRSVRRVAQVRVALHQPAEYVALHAHEAVRRFGDLDEAILVGELADALRAVPDRVERVLGVAILELALGRPA